MNTLSFDKDNLLEKYKPDFAIGYGSGVFLQEGYDKNEKPMIDLIFGVESPADRHEENMKKNPQDYSGLVRTLGSRFAMFLQNTGAKLYYNPYVEFENCTIKYGVISKENLLKDLRLWEHLYAAGRLHKPVEVLQDEEEIHKAMKSNFMSAVHTALLLLPAKFTEEELYTTIAGISYTGDHRMQYGENPQKVSNIVKKNME